MILMTRMAGIEEGKEYNTKDGRGIIELTKKGFPVAFLSSGYSKGLVQSRAKRLGVSRVFVGKGDKSEILQEWCNEMGILPNEVAYVGDDINDAKVMEICGLTACPADAVKKIKSIAQITLSTEGGKGCLREFIEEYLIHCI